MKRIMNLTISMIEPEYIQLFKREYKITLPILKQKDKTIQQLIDEDVNNIRPFVSFYLYFKGIPVSDKNMLPTLYTESSLNMLFALADKNIKTTYKKLKTMYSQIGYNFNSSFFLGLLLKNASKSKHDLNTEIVFEYYKEVSEKYRSQFRPTVSMLLGEQNTKDMDSLLHIEKTGWKKPITESKWSVDKERVNYAEIREFVRKCFRSESRTSQNLLNLIEIYIIHKLEHPLDGFHVQITDLEQRKTIGGTYAMNFALTVIKAVACLVALKHHIKIPLTTAVPLIRDTGLADVLIHYVKNIDLIFSELETLQMQYKRYLSLGKRKDKILATYILAFMLHIGKNDWNEFSLDDIKLTDFEQLHQNGNLFVLDFTAVNYIYEHKFGIKYMLSQKSFEKQVQKIKNDQVEHLIKLYKHYLSTNNRSVLPFETAKRIFSHRTKNMKNIEDLTLENLKKIVDKFVTHTKENQLDVRSSMYSLREFCNLLNEMKSVFGEQNIFGEVFAFPFEFDEIFSP